MVKRGFSGTSFQIVDIDGALYFHPLELRFKTPGARPKRTRRSLGSLIHARFSGSLNHPHLLSFGVQKNSPQLDRKGAKFGDLGQKNKNRMEKLI